GVAAEGGIELGDDAYEPGARRPVALQRGRGRFLVAGTEGAGPAAVLLHGQRAGPEGLGSLGAIHAHDHPPAGERIEAELAHGAAGLSPSVAVEPAITTTLRGYRPLRSR